ncbi:WD40 repeat domain-containing protein [Streptomyces sp. NBC_01478]
MVETWRRRSGNRLTLDGYLAAGGIQHALARTAETAYRALSPVRQDLARSLFLRLTALGDGTEDTRRRITADELDPGPDTAFVLESLARQRLLLHRQLTDATADWEAHGRDPHAVWRGARLSAALDLAAVDGKRLTSRERSFLDASSDAQAGELAAVRRRTVRLRQLATLLTVLVITAVTTGVLVVASRDSAVRQRNVAVARKVATDAAELRQQNPALAAQLNLAAFRLAPTADVRAQLMNTFATPYTSRLTGHTADVVSTAFAPRNSVVATASWDRTVRLWDVRNAHRPVRLAVLSQPWRMLSVSFGRGGRVLATASERSVRLWDVTDPRAPAALSSLPESAAGPLWLVFRPGGDTIAVGHTDGVTRLWNVRDPRHPRWLATLPGHTGAVTSAAFSPDGHTLATTGDTTARLWDVTDPAEPRRLDVLRGHTDIVTSVAFSPDGRSLATGSWDHTARIWHLGDGGSQARPPTVLPGHTAIVWSVAFGPDGRTLVSVGGSTLFWDLTEPDRPRRVGAVPGGAYQAVFSPDGRVLANADRLLDLSLATHDDVVTSVAFAPGGRLLASASWDGTARLWQVTGGRALWPLAVLRGHTRFVRSVAFSPDGRTLVTASEDTTVRVWDVTDPRRPRLRSVLPCDAGEVAGAGFAPGGRLLVVWAQHGAGLWDLSDPGRPRPLSRIAEGGPDVTMASFRPDGRTLVTSTGNVGTLRFWDIGDPRSPRELPSPLRSLPLTDGVFSPDDRRLAAVHRPDRAVWLIDLGDLGSPPKVTRLRPSGSWLYALAFSPDGRRLAAGAADGKALLWDVRDTTTTAPAVLTGHANPVPAVAFGPQGDTLATGGNDFTIRLWDTGLDRVAARVCDSAYPRITRAEWARYFAATDFDPPCRARG